ncbi:MAG TPA: hypothetical protein VF260_13480 [Bacilli bacterium]
MPAHAFLILAILTFALAIIALDARILLAQVILFLGYFFLKDSTVLFTLAGILQIVLGVFTLYRCKRFIDYDYYLQLEKTRLARPNLTKGGNKGGDFNLFRKPY